MTGGRCSICRHAERDRIEQLPPTAAPDLTRQLVTLNALALEAASSLNQQLRVLAQSNELLLAQSNSRKVVGNALA